jgi:hypothetical protein
MLINLTFTCQSEEVGLTARFLSRITFKLVCHSLEEFRRGTQTRSKDSKGMVTLHSKEEDGDLFATWCFEIAVQIWELSGGFLGDGGLEVRI